MNRSWILRTITTTALTAGTLLLGTGTAQAALPVADSGQPTAVVSRDVAHPISAARDTWTPPTDRSGAGQRIIAPCSWADGALDPDAPYVFDLREMCGPLRANQPGTTQPGTVQPRAVQPGTVPRGTVFNEAAPADVRTAEGARAQILPLPVTAPSHILPLRVFPGR